MLFNLYGPETNVCTLRGVNRRTFERDRFDRHWRPGTRLSPPVRTRGEAAVPGKERMASLGEARAHGGLLGTWQEDGTDPVPIPSMRTLTGDFILPRRYRDASILPILQTIRSRHATRKVVQPAPEFMLYRHPRCGKLSFFLLCPDPMATNRARRHCLDEPGASTTDTQASSAAAGSSPACIWFWMLSSRSPEGLPQTSTGKFDCRTCARAFGVNDGQT
jgi:hypothetical protein